jgi:membrane protease subunit HflK
MDLIIILIVIVFLVQRFVLPNLSEWKNRSKDGDIIGQDGKIHRKLPKMRFPSAKIIVPIILVAVAVIIISGSYYNVHEQENAVVTMFGKVVRTDTAGLHFKLPLIQQVRKVDITTHGTGIGYNLSDDGQNFAANTDGIMITRDFNFIDIDFYMEYKVSDPVAYLYNSTEPEQILKNIALASIRSTLIDYDVDDAITTGKSQIQAEVKEKMARALEEQNIGLSVVNMTVQDAEPPTIEIIQAFKSVETAKQGKETAINNANKYRNEQVPAAEARADRIRQSAEGRKAARIAEAEGQVARFNAMYEQYSLNPLITRQRLFYETMENVLPGTKVIITDGSTQTMLPLESFTGSGNTAGNADAGGAVTNNTSGNAPAGSGAAGYGTSGGAGASGSGT